MAKKKFAPKQTPMMQQFDTAKAAHPDRILFFRMGDFYEMFHDDAVTASRILGLTLTSRSKGEDPIPMAGVPHHSAAKYIEQLIAAGHRVAICDQMADPAACKGIVPREVTRVVTPGTVIEDESLSAAAPNYLAAATSRGADAGVAWVDLSTGEFFLEDVPVSTLADALERVGPAECLLPEGRGDSNGAVFNDLGNRRIGLRTAHPAGDFEAKTAVRLVKEQYGVASLDGFGLEETSPAVGAAGAIIRYLNETQRARVRHLHPPRLLGRDDCLILDRTSIRNLELVDPLIGKDRRATLFHVINRTCTPPGARRLRAWLLRPLARADAVRHRQEAVGELMHDHFRRGELRDLLSSASDVERILGRVGCSRATPRDLAGLGRTLALLPDIAGVLGGVASAVLNRCAEDLGGAETLASELERALVDSPPAVSGEGGIFRTGYHDELDELREIRAGGKDWIADFQRTERERTGIQSLKVGFNKVFGYYIEITKANLENAPGDYQRKQTLVNAERFITPQLKSYEEKVLGAEERIIRIEQELFLELRESVAAETRALQRIASALARIDAHAALAELGAAENYRLPEVNDGRAIRIMEGRHPVLEAMLPSGEFVANDLEVDPDDSRLLIVTGPNMAGKSTYIRQCALLVILAQMGAPIPAREASVGVVDRVFTRVGAADDLARGQSTFMVEMNEAANILNNATEKSFVVLDELGRGTSTYDGVSLAWSLTEYIHNHLGARCVFATHYHELAELGLILPAAANLNVAVRDWGGEIIFLHRIQPGSADRSYGIHVARLAGIPKPVIARAQSILEELEAHAADRDSSILGQTETLRAAAQEKQLTLFDDPDRDALCSELAALDPAGLSADEAAEILQQLHARADRWRETMA